MPIYKITFIKEQEVFVKANSLKEATDAADIEISGGEIDNWYMDWEFEISTEVYEENHHIDLYIEESKLVHPDDRKNK